LLRKSKGKIPPRARQEDIWGNGSIAPPTVAFGTRCR